MPLRDHFHRPARGLWHWKSFHSTWATCITQHLNQKPLPPGYLALPQVQLATVAQVDVATVYEEEEELQAMTADGAVATAVWAPPKPALVVPADIANLDTIEIEVRNEEEGYRLVAAIELVSPANKDRPSNRRAFAAKCAAYLQQDVSVIVVDMVTERQENLHVELMDLLELGEGKAAVSSDLYAVAYRALGRDDDKPRLEMWLESLRLGEVLPTLPVWIARDRAVPLDLEASYTAACESLRMR